MLTKTKQSEKFVPSAADAVRAEQVLTTLADAFWADGLVKNLAAQIFTTKKPIAPEELPDVTSRYKILVEQIPAIVFMAFLENGLSEAYVSPQVERMLGFTQEEWLNDPVRWYAQIHPDDKARWSVEAAQTFLTGATLRSVYRVLARDNRVIWFQCEVRMVRRDDGRPWFVHGVGFDITELKQVETALTGAQQHLQRNVVELKQEIEARKKVETALRASAERQKELSRRLLEAQEAERRHLALELHDEIGQKLTGLKFTLELGARQPEKCAEVLAQAQTLVNELMSQTRRLSLALRPATLDHLGLLPALVWHFRNFTKQTNIEVGFDHENLANRRFDAALETAVYRVVQEALTNVARHAAASSVTVKIRVDRERLMLCIEDDGKGFELTEVLAEITSTGLTGMRERVALLGGEFQLESNIGAGTKLVAEINL